MNYACTKTVQPQVTSGTIVSIEADLSRGLHSFSIVGLATKAVEEAKDRVSSAIKHSGFDSPKSHNQKITISLLPADLTKEGPLFDLPIAIAYLVAHADITLPDSAEVIMVGELGLDGTIHPVRGVLNIVLTAKQAGFTSVIVPHGNALEAALVEGVSVYPAKTLKEVVNHLDTTKPEHRRIAPHPVTEVPVSWPEENTRLEDIKGQEGAKRALIIAAAGRHNVMLVGPPGTGKTLLARAFRGILPPLSRTELLEVVAIHSQQGHIHSITAIPPFRAPHHTASYTALVGGGTYPRPGEVSLAHRGVLFMDEFPEFERRSLDALRQPLEDKVVHIARIQGSALFPADFILVAALNPYRGREDGQTNLMRAMQETYKQKISGPILDRIDLWVEVPHVPYEILQSARTDHDETTTARTLIQTARETQLERFRARGIRTNGEMSARDIEDCLSLSPEVETLFRDCARKLNLSPRSYHRLIKVARSIADLDCKSNIETAHVYEALSYRPPVE